MSAHARAAVLFEALEVEVGQRWAEAIVSAALDVIQAARAAGPSQKAYEGRLRIIVNRRGAVVAVFRSIEIEQAS